MPFTLSHPIAVLPVHGLTRGRLPLSALVIGSMVPDVSYFVWLRPTGELGHTWWGLLVQGMPAGIVLYVVWVWVVRAPALAMLPRWVLRRVPEPGPRAGWAAAAIAVAIGAASHIVWDGFTHETGAAVARWAWLRTQIGWWPLWRWGQYGGGVFGGLGVAVWAVWRLWRAPAREVRGGGFVWAWVWIGVGAIVTSAIAVSGVEGVRAQVVRGVIGAISGSAAAMFVYAIAWWGLWRGRRVVWSGEEDASEPEGV